MAEDVGSLVVRVAMENSSFQQGIQNLQRSMKVIQSEFKNATSGLEEHGKGLDGLKAKADMLGKSLDVQSKIVKAYEDKLKESQSTLESNSKKHMQLADSVVKAERAYKESEKTLGKNAQETQKLKAEYEKLQDEFIKSEEKIRNNARTIDNWGIKTNNAKARLSELERELSKTTKAVEMQSSIWTKVSNHMNEFGNKTKLVGEKLGNVGRTITTHISTPLALLGVGASKAAIDFESAFAGVKKTVNGTNEQFKQLEVGIRDMSKQMPTSASDIAHVAEAAGQLGIKTDNILGFTKTIIDLGNATNLVGEEGASELAKFANITSMSQKDFDRLGSTIVALGNNMATTESDIVAMGMRLAGAGHQVGLTEAQIMGLSAALSSVGIEAEAGGSAISKVMVDMQLSTEVGGESLENFAKVAGMSSDQFKKSFKEDAAGALTSFIKGLSDSEKKGTSAIKVLDDMGITEVRMRDALLRAAGAGDLFNKSISIGTKAWQENTALANEANQRYATTESKLKIIKNQITDAGITIGNNLLPVIRDVSVKIAAVTEGFAKLSPQTQKFVIAVAGIGIGLGPALIGISNLILAVGNISGAFGKVAAFLAEKQIATKIAQMFKIPAIPSNLFAGFTMGLQTLGTKISAFMVGPWKALGNGFKSLPGLIKNFSFTNIITKIITPFKNIPTLLKGVFAKIPTLLNGVKTLFMTFGSTIIGLGPKILMAIRSAFSIQGIMTAARAALALFTGPWGALALGIAAVVGGIIANWDKIKEWVQQHFGGTLPQNFEQFSQVFQNIWTTIQQVFSNVWESMKQVATDVWNYIGPTIMSGVTAVQSFWSEVWPQIQQVFVEVWNVMKIILGPAVAGLYTIISAGIGLIKGIWGPAWNVIKDTLKIVWDGITGVIKIAWDIISGVIKVGLDLLTGNWSKAWEDMKTIFSNLWNDIKSLFSNMATDAVTWGKDMVQGIIDGIKGMIGGVGDAASNIASTIRSYLHFTVPDVGPLSDADTYGGDFMELLANTINENSNKPEAAAKKVADLVAQKIKSVKDMLAKDTKDLNSELYNIGQQEERALRGVKGNDRYSIKDEYEAKKKAIKDHIALRKEQANKEISELQRVTKMSKEELKKEADARKDFVKKVNDLQKQLVDALKEKYKEEEKLQEESLNKEIENLDSWKEESQKRIEEVYDSKIKAIEEATKAQEKALNAEIEMMEREDKLEEREEKENDDLAKIKSLQDRIEFEHNEFNKEELKKELANVQAEREKRLRQEAREDKKEDLKKQIDDLKENSDKKKEKLEQEKKYEISRLEQLYKAQKQNLQKRLSDVKTFFAEKTKEARLQAEAEKLIMDNNQKEIVSLLHSYEKDYELAGQSLGERLVNGFKPAIDSIKSMIDGLAKQLAELKAEAGGSISSLSSISRGTSSNSYNTHNSNTVINNNYSATINSPVARTPSQERRSYESTMRRLAFEMR